MPVNAVKIDSTLTKQWASESGKRIIRSIIGLAGSLGLSVIAQGIENREQQGVLSQWGCEAGQGRFYTEAIPTGEVDAWIFDNNIVE
jgi:EAL domain-containing protein (putative c-di-GMP-specific phosphodiesterase class I)